MRTRLSVPLLLSIAVPIYIALIALMVVITASDFHLTAFIGGWFFCKVVTDAARLFSTNKGDRS